MSENSDIAIVGIGCRFPGANNIDEYWRVLSKGENHVVEIPKSRWNLDAFYNEDPAAPGKSYCRRAGLVHGIDEWDHRPFGFSDIEAEITDPQQRMVLDCVHMALEDGGITRKDIEGSNTAVYIGVMTNDYREQIIDSDSVTSPYTVTGSHPSIISARVSYVYNLCGPALTVDTACSSSLVAMDLGSQALVAGSCSMAICGGVNVLLDPQMFTTLCKARMLSPTGQCQTFTKFADGYARGEGCGIVILKTLENAKKDGNRILGTIKIGTNQDGHNAMPITAPSSIQQLNLMENTYCKYQIDRQNIQVIEAHGTGTPIGDPTEVDALRSFFGSKTKKTYIGSVKTNIGHLEAAAGVAGVIKILLMMQHGQIVPSLWYSKENENPKLKFKEHRFVVPTECVHWELTGGQERIACVNSFGFGGTNAHAVLKQYISSDRASKTNLKLRKHLPLIFTISAFDNISLRECAKQVGQKLQDTQYTSEAISYTSTCKRDHFPVRKAFLFTSQSELQRECQEFATNTAGPFVQKASGEKRIVFVFCGVGTTWQNMSNWLLKNKTFKKEIENIDRYLHPLIGWKVKDKLKAKDNSVVTDPVLGHIAIFAYQIALAKLWMHLGIKPNAVLGQSVGEVAAGHIAGYFDLQTAVNIIFHRSTSLANVNTGTMAVVRNVATDLVEKFCLSTKTLNIAVFNSPVSCTVSGEERDLKAMESHFTKVTNGVSSVIFLGVKCAYHSKFVEEAAKIVKKKLTISSPLDSEREILLFSSVTGETASSEIFRNPQYWERNVRLPVLFYQAIRKSRVESRHTVYLEIGPSPVLLAHFGSIFPGSENTSVVVSIKNNRERETFTKALCNLYEFGLELQWPNLIRSCQTITDIPRHHGQRKKQLYVTQAAIRLAQNGSSNKNLTHPFITPVQNPDGFEFEAVVDSKTTSYVYQHKIGERILLPGAYYAEVGLSIAQLLTKYSTRTTSISLEFLRPVRLDNGKTLRLKVTSEQHKSNILFHVLHNQTVSCKGAIKYVDQNHPYCKPVLNIRRLEVAIRMSSFHEFTADDVYKQFDNMGFVYGERFRLISRFMRYEEESISEIAVPSDILEENKNLSLHPCVLDAMLQTTILTVPKSDTASLEQTRFLPVAIEGIVKLQNIESSMKVYTKLINATNFKSSLHLHFNIFLTDLHGNVVVEIRNFSTFSKRSGRHVSSDLNYELAWCPLQLSNHEAADPRILMFARHVKSFETKVLERNSNLTLINLDENSEFVNFMGDVNSSIDRTTIEKNVDVIVFLIKSISLDCLFETIDGTSRLQKVIRDNCAIMLKVLLYIREKGITKPVYIVTENTQHFDDRHVSGITNCIGSEMWGFIRSANVEFITETTMIDLQPSFNACQDALFSYIRRTYKVWAETKTEVIVKKNSYFASEFSKISRFVQTPNKRAMNIIHQNIEKNYQLFSNSSTNYLSSVPEIQNFGNDKNKSKHLSMLITSVFELPNEVFRVAQNKTHFDAWAFDPGTENPLYATEFAGYIEKRHRSSSFFKCKAIRENVAENFDGMRESVALFPSKIYTRMIVPRALVVNTKDIPFYQPGMLSYALLYYHIVCYIPTNATVYILSDNTDGLAYTLMHNMLKNLKLANVKHVDEISNVKQSDILVGINDCENMVDICKYFTHIICLQGFIDVELLEALTMSRHRKITVVYPSEVFEMKELFRHFPKVLIWLRNHYTIFQEKHPLVQLPCKVLQIMNSKSQSLLPIRNSLKTLFSKENAYIITGGLSGLGWELTKVIAKMGAGVVLILSRNEPNAETKENIRQVQMGTQCQIVHMKANVCDLTCVRKAVSDFEMSFKGRLIKGIFHCAGISQGKLLIDMKSADIESVLKPKVLGTANLHLVSIEFGLTLDYFVLASSISSLIGSPGQTHYSAANSFLDAFARWRREKGLPGQAINWGALNVGMASDKEIARMFATRGFNLMSEDEIKCCFKSCLLQNCSNVVFADINWDITADYFKSQGMKRIQVSYSNVIKESSSSVTKAKYDTSEYIVNIDDLKRCNPTQQWNVLSSVVQHVVKMALGYHSETEMLDRPLSELPFDSMSTMTVINLLHQHTGYRIQTEFMLDSSRRVCDITTHLYKNLFHKSPVLGGKGTVIAHHYLNEKDVVTKH